MASAAFQRIQDFLQHEMRMSHIYQPVMIREMLQGDGQASVTQIARALLAEDKSQI